MKNVSKIIPCYAADTSGVCSALYELSGMTVVHDASGCNSTYATHDEPRWENMRSNIFISALTEMDAIMGNDEKLIADTVSAAKDKAPAFISVCGSPMPMMTGVDFEAVAQEIENRSGIRTFGLHTNGTLSYIEGASQAFLNVVREYAKPLEKIKNGVNVLGLTPLDFPLKSDVSIKNWLKENGFVPVCTLAMGDTLEDVKKMASAEVSLVVSYSGLAAAQFLWQEYKIPYICGVPIGRKFAARLADELTAASLNGECKKNSFTSGGSDIAVIGEGIYSRSLASAVVADLGLGAFAVAALPTDSEMLSDNDKELSAEEDIEELLNTLKPQKVIADPLYKYIVPKETGFVSLPHFAFSGRCFEREFKDLINTDIQELLK